MTLFLAALAASYLVVLLIGLLGGLYLNRGMRRVPDHPVLRIHHDEPPKRWRVIEGGLQRPNALYDWANLPPYRRGNAEQRRPRGAGDGQEFA